MTDAQSKHEPYASSVNLISRASASGEAPIIQRMPRPTHRRMLDMRDGTRLDTWVWLPVDNDGPFPSILIRTPYQEHVLGWARLGTERYRNAGYAVIFQLVRGTGASEGNFKFFDPMDAVDGFDTIEWIAGQPWSNGAVGMDGSSYAGVTQLAAAAAQPPHLKCIIPAVVSIHPFMHIPRYGGAISRQHTLGWTEIISVDNLGHLTPGLWGAAALLGSPESWARLLSRPAIDAAVGVLTSDRLTHYEQVLRHDTFDQFVEAQTLGPDEFSRMNTPAMLVTGLFDATMGTQYAWHCLERYAPSNAERTLLIGPWDHGEAYVGGSTRKACWNFGEQAVFDLPGARLAFFDKHLKGEARGIVHPDRVRAFIVGANVWLDSDKYPHSDTRTLELFLHSDGLANMREHGRLLPAAPKSEQPADSFLSDPSLPFVAVGANLDPDLLFDLRELERQEDVLTYTSDVFTAPQTLFGEFSVELQVECDTPDCDIACWLAEVPPDGRTRMLSWGYLRLSYREGFTKRTFLQPGIPVIATIEMYHVAHRIDVGSRLRLLIGGGMFPLIDPNPHSDEAIADAVAASIARQSVHHGLMGKSVVRLPVINENVFSRRP